MAERFTAALDSFEDTRGLIIDLRGTAGGFFSAVDSIAGRLVAGETPFAS